MANFIRDLEEFAYHEANFANSCREPSGIDRLISGPKPFYYHWRKDGSIDILIFRKSTSEAKMFRYTPEQLHSGVDLGKDVPLFVDDEVAQILMGYAIEYAIEHRSL